MKDWKKEFAKLRESLKAGIFTPKERVKFYEDFIEEALKAQRLAFIKMIEKKMINKQVISMDEAIYNMALDEAIKELKESAQDARET